jgi:hypothetical protein
MEEIRHTPSPRGQTSYQKINFKQSYLHREIYRILKSPVRENVDIILLKDHSIIFLVEI